MSKTDFLKGYQSISSNKLIQIELNEGLSTLVFITVNKATGLYSADGNWQGYVSLTKLSGPLKIYHFKAYTEDEGNIYVKTSDETQLLTVTSIGSNHNFRFVESDKDVSTLKELNVTEFALQSN